MASPVASTMERSESMISIPTSIATEVPSGPLSGPSDTTWRRQRLLRIGSSQNFAHNELEDHEETAPIIQRRNTDHKVVNPSYGTLPHVKQKKAASLTFRKRHGLPALPALRLSSYTPSVSSSPTQGHATLDRSSILRVQQQRPISAYDATFDASIQCHDDLVEAEGAVRANGIRVWYSSFSSVDWLHDAIKDSMRMYRLRRHKSLRGRMLNAADRLMGWIVVTIVGFLTAIAAFLITRSERWFFDIKYGYCTAGWWKARTFCCPGAISDFTSSTETTCEAWLSWGEALTHPGATPLYRTLVGRSTYALSAVRSSPPFFLFVNVLKTCPRISYSSRWSLPFSPYI
jgi:chloride channel 3/4/5